MENNITNNQNKSGGPKTPEGKAVSKYNAVRHGILVKVLSGQEIAEANVIQTSLMFELKPESLLEVFHPGCVSLEILTLSIDLY